MKLKNLGIFKQFRRLSHFGIKRCAGSLENFIVDFYAHTFIISYNAGIFNIIYKKITKNLKKRLNKGLGKETNVNHKICVSPRFSVCFTEPPKPTENSEESDGEQNHLKALSPRRTAYQHYRQCALCSGLCDFPALALPTVRCGRPNR